jgi:hypothetical protein
MQAARSDRCSGAKLKLETLQAPERSRRRRRRHCRFRREAASDPTKRSGSAPAPRLTGDPPPDGFPGQRSVRRGSRASRNRPTLTATRRCSNRRIGFGLVGLSPGSELAAGFGRKQSSGASWRASARVLSFRGSRTRHMLISACAAIRMPSRQVVATLRPVLSRSGSVRDRQRLRVARSAESCGG